MSLCFFQVFFNISYASENTLEKIKATEALTWGFDAEGGAPHVFENPRHPSKLIGFEVEIVKAIARELGVKVHYFQNEWDNILHSLKRGDFDIAINGIEITPEREQSVLFTRPYYVCNKQIVVRSADFRINKIKDLRNKKVGILYNNGSAKQLLEETKDVTVQEYHDQTRLFKELLENRIDAVFVDLPVASYYAKPNPQLRLVGGPIGEGYYGIAVRKEDTAFAEELNRIIEKLLRTGELKKICQKWGLWNVSQEKLYLHEGLLQKYTETPPSLKERTPLVVTTFLPTLFKGALVTIGISIMSMILAIALGILLAMMRLNNNKWTRKISVAYIEIYRCTPLLVQLYILYYGLPNIGITLNALSAAVIGLGMYYAAYVTEIYYAEIPAIQKGKTDTETSPYTSKCFVFKNVIQLQAFRITMPSVVNNFVSLLKDSSLVSVIALVELTKSYSILAATSMDYLKLGLITALLYFGISYPLSLYARKLERSR